MTYNPYRKKPAKREITPLSQILPTICESLALDEKVKEMAVLALWSQLVEEPYRSRSKAVRLQKRGEQRVLWVRVADAALAGDLSFQLGTLLMQFNHYAPQTGVTLDQIHLQIGSID